MASKRLLIIFVVLLACLNVHAQVKESQQEKGSLSVSNKTADTEKQLFPFVGEINIENVNVRAGQSKNFEKLCELKKGALVVVVDRSYSWYKIEIPESAKSYVSSDFIQLLGNKTGEVIGSRVNVRAGMGTNHYVLGQLKKGDKIYILEEMDQWYKIKPAKGTYGWISDNYITFKGRDVEGLHKTLTLQKQEEVKKPEEEVKKQEEEKAVKVPEEKIEKGEGKETKEAKPDNLVINKDGSVSITGFLKPQKNSSLEYVQYKLEVDKKTFYYIEGFKYIFDEFLGYKVVVDGKLNKELEEKYKHPVITVNKIELVL